MEGTRGLTAPQLRPFEELGFVLCERVFEPADILPLIAELEAQVTSTFANLQEQGLVSAVSIHDVYIVARVSRLRGGEGFMH